MKYYKLFFIKIITDIIFTGQSGGYTVNPARFERKQQ